MKSKIKKIPPITAFPVYHSSEGAVSAKSFLSRKSVRSQLIKVVKLGSCKVKF